MAALTRLTTTAGLWTAETIHSLEPPSSVSMQTLYLDRETQTIDFLVTAERTGDLSPDCLLVLVADGSGRLVLPIGIDEVPGDPPQDERIAVLAALLELLEELEHPHGVALAVGRLGHPNPRGGDFGWHDALQQCCRVTGLACHGTYVATPYGVRRVRPLVSPGRRAA
jgi:hypothetical protein